MAPPPYLNSKRTLEEINERIEAALGYYEQMEDQNPDKFAHLRREDQAEATYGDLAEAGRARIDLVLVAMGEISSEREVLLGELRAKLDNARHSAEQSEKDEVRARAHARAARTCLTPVRRVM